LAPSQATTWKSPFPELTVELAITCPDCLCVTVSERFVLAGKSSPRTHTLSGVWYWSREPEVAPVASVAVNSAAFGHGGGAGGDGGAGATHPASHVAWPSASQF
jgi:hypothetical protein